MQISAIGNSVSLNKQNRNNQAQSFGNAYVTLSKANLGSNIKEKLIPSFVEKWWDGSTDAVKSAADTFIKKNGEELQGDKLFDGKSNHTISKASDLADKVDFYMLAAGEGSRFRGLAAAVKGWQGEVGGKANENKITLGFPIDGKKDLPMIDFGLNGIAKYFAKTETPEKIAGDTATRVEKTPFESILSDGPTGSFGDIMLRNLSIYRAAEEKQPGSGADTIKDVVVCCGDNVFGEDAESLLKYFTKAVNDENVHLALVGAKKSPEIAAKRFGVIQVADAVKGDNEVLQVTGFEEKPPLEVINAPNSGLVTENGDCVANTGMFYVSKEAMTTIVKKMNDLIPENFEGELKDVEAFKSKELNPFNKNDKEIFDFANVSKWVQAELAKPNGGELGIDDGIAIVKQVGVWEDVGEPKAYLNFLQEAQEGEFIDNFTAKQQDEIQQAISDRVSFPTTDDGIGEISYSEKYDTLAEAKAASDVVSKEVEDGGKVVLNVFVDKK